MQKLSHNHSKFDDFRRSCESSSAFLCRELENRMADFSAEMNLLVLKVKSASRKVGALIFNQDPSVTRH